jgi:hypothetical protein
VWNETKVVGESLAHCHFVQHKSYMDGLGIERGPRGWKQTINRLSSLVAFKPSKILRSAFCRSRDSSVSTATGYGLDDPGVRV